MLKFLSGIVVGALLTLAGLHYNGQVDFDITQYPAIGEVSSTELRTRADDLLQRALALLPGTEAKSIPDAEVQLVEVTDGDSIVVRVDGQQERIRYIGANAPEYEDPCYSDARRANETLLRSGPLSLDHDETDQDRYGRLLRYVYAGDVLVERELIRNGWAEVVKYRSDDKHYEEFRKLEQEAARRGLGCHPSGVFADGSLTR